MIRQLGAGAYTYLPLGFRVLNKAIRIVREEMDAAGAHELLMPALQPIELWKESGRYAAYGDLLMQLTLGGSHTLALGPTHEEVVTDIARALINSYRQLPITLYQIQTKFRNEPRPRFGILRTREFLMKDAYSFDADVEQLGKSYDAMFEAYCRIFDRCGFPYVAVEAESGPIGGDSSHEFMVPCSTGEDTVIQCTKCDYAANRERAEIGAGPAPAAADRRPRPTEAVSTPGRRTIQEVCDFLKTHESTSAKLLIFLADGKPVAALIRGDHEANEAKIRRAFKAATIAPADAATIEKVTGAPLGFLGPVGIKIPLAIDRSVAAMPSMVVGGNAADVHFRGVVPGRDFPLERVLDLRNAVEGDPCPRCGQAMAVKQGIEIGHVFKLGTKYSSAMGATFLDEKGETHPVIMGCYGIGVNRILAAAVEAGHDANGIVWPTAAGPVRRPALRPAPDPERRRHGGGRGSSRSSSRPPGGDDLVDDREQAAAGVKFKDADLIGSPAAGGRRRAWSGRKGTIEVGKWRTDAAAPATCRRPRQERRSWPRSTRPARAWPPRPRRAPNDGPRFRGEGSR